MRISSVNTNIQPNQRNNKMNPNFGTEFNWSLAKDAKNNIAELAMSMDLNHAGLCESVKTYLAETKASLLKDGKDAVANLTINSINFDENSFMGILCGNLELKYAGKKNDRVVMEKFPSLGMGKGFKLPDVGFPVSVKQIIGETFQKIETFPKRQEDVDAAEELLKR